MSDTTSDARTAAVPFASGGLRAAGAVFLVALCLRPAITAVGPLLPAIGADYRLGEAVLGMLGALPLLAFAVVSPLVHRLTGRTGPERAILAALVLLAAGCVVRSYAGPVGLWLGTAAIGSAIAVGNVLLPVLTRRDLPHNVSRATGLYSACMGAAASTASGIAVPVASISDWRASLGVWAVLAALVALAWFPRARAAPAAGADDLDGEAVGPAPWRRPMAWLVTAFMGLQSTCFYVLVTWLPTIERRLGVDPAVAGLHLFLFQVAGLLAGLGVPFLLRHTDQRAGALAASLPVVLAMCGLILAPSLVLLWALLAGAGQGASLVVALSLISLRGGSPLETTRLSGMAQSLGYLLAATGPIAAGALAERTGGWTAPLALVGALGALQVVVGLFAGRHHRPAS